MYRNAGKHHSFSGSQSLWLSQHSYSKPIATVEERQKQVKRPLELQMPEEPKKVKKYQRSSNE